MEDRRSALAKQREAAHADYERQKIQLVAETEKARPSSHRFVGQNDSVEDSLKRHTVGLVHLEDFQARRKELEEERARAAANSDTLKAEQKAKKKRKKAAKATLSFALDEDEDDGSASPAPASTRKSAPDTPAGSATPVPDEPINSGDDDEQRASKRAKKNPGVDTSFLPDRDREESDRLAREELRKEWLARQEQLKTEEIEVVYSYWDGSGHRKSVVCKKGDAIGSFLEKARLQFPELRGVSADNLMYIKEDLIIPAHYTFYDFILNKARGKSGPLFNFDVHDDVRLLADVRLEKDESHAGKVVERSWYMRNKHIFPASRWEVYDPEKDYGKYTIKS
ncbi:XAP5-domain-containing protein [Peniophora sp. CONT]|nr:XAP5-domain-containing protein [Peniophora sp. CONT]